MPTTTTRRTAAALTGLTALAAPALTATPAHAAPARATHASVTYADCYFSDGSAAEISAVWFDDGGSKSVSMHVYRIESGGADLEVTYDRYGPERGPGGLPVYWYAGPEGSGAALRVVVTNGGGAQCYRVLS